MLDPPPAYGLKNQAMSDLLETLAARVRERETPPQWQAVAEGSMTPDEAAEAARAIEPEDRVEASTVLFAPADEATRAATLDAVLGSSNVVSLQAARARRSSRWLVPALGAAAAAALLVVVMPWSSRQDGDAEAPEIVAPLGVAYELELTGGFARTRAAHDPVPTEAPLELTGQAPLELIVRPEVSLPPGVQPDVVVFAMQGPDVRRLTIEPEVLSTGVIRVRGRVSDVLGLPPGTWTLAVVVGPRGRLPETLPETPPDHLQVLRRTVRIAN